MRTQKELTEFIVLRSNGWSLAKISKHLNVPKTTLFRWEEKNVDTIHLLKYVQLEKIQEQYVPSYEEQLKDTHEHLTRIQDALKQQDYTKMSPEFLLQMNFQLQTRLDKIRQQVPLRSPQLGVPLEALPPIGCVTKDEHFPTYGDFSDSDTAVEPEPDLEPVAASPETAAAVTDHGPRTTAPFATDNAPPTTDSVCSTNPSIHSSTNPPIHSTDPAVNGHHRSNGSLRDLRDSVVNPLTTNPNGTFRNENPRGVKNGPLQINDLQQPKRNDRSV
jgi:hypothetical protein